MDQIIIDEATVNEYKRLKKEMEAAYTVFKHSPTGSNASSYTRATQAFTSFCVDTMKSLIALSEDNKQDTILENFDDYKVCKQPGCNAELLYKVNDDHYIASSEFVEDFPGWCYSCLLEYCTTHECNATCERCKELKIQPAACSFREIKNLNMQAQ